MKYIITASLGLFIIVLSGIYLQYKLNYTDDSQINEETDIDISFKVTGTASKPVDYIKFDIVVIKEGPDQNTAKADCDVAAESMLLALSQSKDVKVEPRGIEVNKETDYQSNKSEFVVVRNFDVQLNDISQMESIISGISKIEGCMIRSTEYHSKKVADIRKMAVADGKKKMDDYCSELLAMYSGKKIRIYDIRIDDEDRWGGGASLMMAAPTGNESLQNAQLMKNVEVKISYDVSVYLTQ